MDDIKEIEHNQRTDDLKETGRLEAFSDGVFAVAITLLVLDIHPPPHVIEDDRLLLGYLGSLGATYLAFVTSFATIGIMWINHHRLFTHIKRTDNTLLVFNLLLLLVIVFIPFPTALLADYITLPNLRVAAALYGGTCVLMAVCFNLVWRYASYKNRLLDRKANPNEVRAITGQYRFGPLLYITTFVLAFIYAPASIAMNLLLAVFFAIPGRQSRSTVE